MKTFIYTLEDPRTKEIRYIGKSDNIEKRIKSHITRSKKKKTYLDCWIYSLLENGYKPKIEILDEVNYDEWEYWEIYWIAQFKQWGFKLVNLTKGGKSVNLIYKRKNTSRRKKVIQYTLNGDFVKIYDSITSVFEENKSKKGHIPRCCINKTGKCLNSLWRYYEEDYPLKINPYVMNPNSRNFKKGGIPKNKGRKASIETRLKQSLKKYKKVVGIENGIIFNSMIEAANFYNINVKTLRSQLYYNTKKKLVKYYEKNDSEI
jgi:hypothetical protein